MDLSWMTDEQLEAASSGDLSRLDDQALERIAGGGNASPSPVQTPSATPQSFGSQVKEALGTPLPVLAYKGYQGIQNIFQKGGEALAENLPTGVSPMLPIPGMPPLFRPTPGKGFKTGPNTAAAIGTGVAMAPDIASTILMPGMEGVGKAATGMARRALGFSKGMLKTPFARGQATKAAETALEEGVIGMNPQGMFDRASGLASKAGEGIKGTLNKTPVQIDQAFADLDNALTGITKGASREGTYKGIYEAVDKVKSDLADFAAQGSELPSRILKSSSMNSLKNRLGKSLNYLADLASQGDNKNIVNTLANTIRNAVKSVVSPEEFTSFLQNQKLYNAAELMKKGLNNEISGQMGNAAISLPGLVAGAATGNAPQALAATGLFEAGKRAGAGASANILQGAYKQTPRIGFAAGRVGQEVNKWTSEKEKRLQELRAKLNAR